ncbi:MAG: hypothetical protein FJX51_12115 [Alphaproteobacteria bacterium]|nr:hypothetical protein [Alphaproteobacteria bacterium]
MRRTLAAALFAFALAAQAAAQTPGKVVTDTVFTAAERKAICEYFKVPCPAEARDGEGTKGKGKAEKGGNAEKGEKGGGKGMPPGLAKRDKLPPGLAKRETLPPGLAKRDMPADLAAKLPTRAGLKTMIVDKSVVLVEEATNTVLDVIANVVTK